MLPELTAQLNKSIRLMQHGFYAAADQVLDHLMAEFANLGDLIGQVRVLNIRGGSLVHQNRDVDALVPFIQASELLQQLPGEPSRVHFWVWTNLVRTYCRVEQLEDGRALVNAVRPLLDFADPQTRVAFLINQGGLYEIGEAWESMLEASQAAYTYAQAADNAHWVAMASVNLGIAQMELGLRVEAERSFLEAIPVLAVSDPSSATAAEAALSRVYFELGQDERAVHVGRNALHRVFESSTTPDKGEIGNISFSFGQIFVKYGHRNLALKYFNRAAAYFSQIGMRSRWLRTNEAIGLLLRAPVRPARADLREEMYQLDFLTALLDLTDDLESVEPTLRGHADRVSLLAINLGKRCGLSEAQIRTLAHAARLHDVGKSAIDVDLLRRQGALTQVEERRVSLHPVLGEEMVRAYGMSADGLAGIRYHHEQWDGKGFPDRLAKEEIPLFARIISVVNSYDVWTFGVGDRPLLGHDRALERLETLAGSVFDPTLVSHFIQMSK
ncbi:MAG TPA: HD domain-containing phosphohydrolase [Symbiobacteriaceae bacterium]|nr:HD domain-containing phosphohydrolase [Symbiobacteriaceae bacterium]